MLWKVVFKGGIGLRGKEWSRFYKAIRREGAELAASRLAALCCAEVVEVVPASTAEGLLGEGMTVVRELPLERPRVYPIRL